MMFLLFEIIEMNLQETSCGSRGEGMKLKEGVRYVPKQTKLQKELTKVRDSLQAQVDGPMALSPKREELESLIRSIDAIIPNLLRYEVMAKIEKEKQE